CAGSSISTPPEPVMVPSGGAIAPADGSVLKPAPGTLSNVAASFFGAASYADGFAFGSGIALIGFSLLRTSSPRSRVGATRRTPRGRGSNQRTAPEGGAGAAPGF